MAAGIAFCDLKIPFILLLCFIYVHPQPGNYIRENVRGVDRRSQRLMIWSATDIIKSTYQLVDSVEYVRQNNLNTPNYEIGYLMFTIFEKYEKMLNKYNTSLTMRRALWIAELIFYLEEIENHHWEVEHLSNMLHEIENKYNVTTSLKTKYHEKTLAEIRKEEAERSKPEKGPRIRIPRVTKKKKRSFKVDRYLKDRLTTGKKTTRRRPFPIDYGWEIDWWKK